MGTDGTGSMTGPHSRFIRSLEVLLNKPLQWSICLLHCNELPLQHILTILDGTTRSPDSFSDPIGKLLGTDVSEWPVVGFKRIQKTNFAILPDKVIEDLSADQKYAYKICLAVSKESIEKDIQYLKVGPIVHSRWITLACRILHFYVSTRHPSENLVLLAKYCLNVYFPSWFETKRCNKIPDRANSLI